MTVCPECNHRYREPEDEQLEHDCPKCGTYILHEDDVIYDDESDGWFS